MRRLIHLLTRAENTKGLPPKTALDDPWFATDAFDGIAELLPEVMQVEATQVPQLNPFELLPNTLARIQLRGIHRDRLAQLMDMMAVA